MTVSEIEAASRDMAEVLLTYAESNGNDRLDDDMLEGAWVTGLVAPQQMGATLLAVVLKGSDAEQDTPLLRRILNDLPRMPRTMQDRQGERLVTFMSTDPPAAADLLASFQGDLGARVASGAQEPLTARARPLLAAQHDNEDPEGYEQRQREAVELTDALGQVLDGLIERDALANAEGLALTMLGSLGIPGRGAVEQRLMSLTPIRRSDLAAQCLRMAELRPAGRCRLWLDALDPADAWSDGGQRLLRVARKLGVRVGKDEVTENDLSATSSALERLRANRGWPGKLDVDEVIGTSEDLSYDRFQDKLEMAQPLADLDLLDCAQLAAARAAAAARELRRAHDQAVDQQPAALFVIETLREVLESLDVDAFEGAWDASKTEQWLPALEGSRLLLIFTVAAKHGGLSIDGAADLDTVQAYIATHGADLDDEVGEWLALDPGNASIRKVIEAYSPRLPTPMLDALRLISADASPKRRLELCRAFLDSRPGKLLEALAFHEADQLQAAALLIELYGRASRNDAREQVLLLWRALRPTENEPRRQLIQKVMIPMATENGQALDYVLREIDLARDPPKTKSALRKALQDGGRRFKREKQVRSKLRDLGWAKRTGPLGLRQVDVD